MSLAPVWKDPAARGLPPWAWWVATAAVVTSLMLGGWLPATALVLAIVAQVTRPFDFLTAFLLVAGSASVVNYSAGHLTAELSLLTMALLYMLFCYMLVKRRAAVTIPHTDLTRPMIVYSLLTLFNFGRGMLAGNSPRYGGLELLAMLSLATLFLAANLKLTRRVIAICCGAMFIIGVIHCVLGLYAYAVIGRRSGAIFFQPASGILVAFGLPFVLREEDRRRRLMYLFSLLPMFLHQFVSFTRGYWMAMIGTIVYSLAVYGARGAGAGARWRRGATMIGSLVVIGVVGIVVFAGAFGFGNIFASAGERFASSGTTEVTFESTSNIVRLAEYLRVLEDVVRNPIFGYGLGYSFVVEDPMSNVTEEHWFVHQNYLLVWLKQGIIGLAVFVWVLVAALTTGYKGRNLPDPYQAAWCAGSSAVALWMLIYCNVHFPLAEVNSTFLTGLIWGGSMALVARDWTQLRWRVGT